jgi:hypothetical protein
MFGKSALAGMAVAACFAVGTSALAQSVRHPGTSSTVFLSSPLETYSPPALVGPQGTVAPSLLSSEMSALLGNRSPLQSLAMTAAIAPGIDISAGNGLDLTSRFNSLDPRAASDTSGLFLNSATAPYGASVNGGNFVGVTVALASDLHFSVGHASLSANTPSFDLPLLSSLNAPFGLRSGLYGHDASATVAGVNWNFSSWGGLELMGSSASTQNALTASVDASRAALSKASSNAVTASAKVGLGDGWVTTVSYAQGVTQLDLRPNNLLGANLDTRAYSVSVAKHGLFADNDSLGLAVSRPIQDFAGRMNVASLDDGNALTDATRLLPFGTKPETDLELGYVTSFFNGALNLQANAAYQMNVEGQNGANSLTVLSRAKINF